jgi:NTP pyrophosphatase (non-canonical NTP hydrolase)
MELKQLQEGVAEHCKLYGEEYGIRMDEEFSVLKLGEEYGEFIQAYMIHKKMARPAKLKEPDKSLEEMGKELADVLGCTLYLAHILGIDIEGQLNKKWSRRINTKT